MNNNISLSLGSLKMRTKVKEKIQRERSRGDHRLFHPMLQQLPYQPLDPSLQPSLVSRRTILYPYGMMCLGSQVKLTQLVKNIK